MLDRFRGLDRRVIVALFQGELKPEGLLVGPMALPFADDEGCRPFSLGVNYLMPPCIEVHTRLKCGPWGLYVDNEEVNRLPERFQIRTHLLSHEASSPVSTQEVLSRDIKRLTGRQLLNPDEVQIILPQNQGFVPVKRRYAVTILDAPSQ